MNVLDLIFLACLSLNQGSSCKQEMLNCAVAARDSAIKPYLDNKDFKKMKPEEFLSGQPQFDWQAIVLDCALKQEEQPKKSSKKK